MKPTTLAALLLSGSMFLGWSGLQKEGVGTSSGPVMGGSSGNPTLSEVRQQCNEIAAFFPVEVALARRWVPQTYKLEVDAQGKASGALIFMNCPKYIWVTTPKLSSPAGRQEHGAGIRHSLVVYAPGTGRGLASPRRASDRADTICLCRSGPGHESNCRPGLPACRQERRSYQPRHFGRTRKKTGSQNHIPKWAQDYARGLHGEAVTGASPIWRKYLALARILPGEDR